MSTTYLGGLSVAQAVPLVSTSLAQLNALVAPQAARASSITTQLATPFVPPNLAAMVAALSSEIGRAHV